MGRDGATSGGASGVHADGVALNYAATTDRVHEVVSSARATAERADRDPSRLRFAAHVFVFLDDDEEAATERFRSILESIPGLRHEAGLTEAPVSAETARQRAASGPAQVISARLDDYLAAGATEVILCDVTDVIATVDSVLAENSDSQQGRPPPTP